MPAAVRRGLLAASLALVVAACGGDDEPGGTTTRTQAAGEPQLTEAIPPLAAAPNVKGGSGAIDKFAKAYASAAVTYWADLFAANEIAYRPPMVTLVKRPQQTPCGAPFDPKADLYELCPGTSGARVFLGAPSLDDTRAKLGDAAVAFLAGYGVALDALDQLQGNPLAAQQELDEKFTHGAVCMTGAWIAHITQKELLEAGDNAELLQIAERFVPGRTELDVSLGQDLLALGVSQGPAGCLREVRS